MQEHPAPRSADTVGQALSSIRPALTRVTGIDPWQEADCGRVRNRTDPYLFLNIDERLKAASNAFQAGDCGHARTAIQRALQMDATNPAARSGAQQIDRACSDGGERLSPNLRR